MRGEDVTYVCVGEVRVLRVTQKAALVDGGGDLGQRWVPLSVVDWELSDLQLEVGGGGRLWVAEWFARKEGIPWE